MFSPSSSSSNGGSYDLFQYDSIASTQDTAKEILKSDKMLRNHSTFAVLAGQQTKGRGTNGRTWKNGNNNMYLTVGFKMADVPIHITLLPLRISTLILPVLASRITDNSLIKLKWPNDILINEGKVSGTLIEIEDGYVLVGIGCNIATAPTIDVSGGEGGRSATCLVNHMGDKGQVVDTVTIATDIISAIARWISSSDDKAENVIRDFQASMSMTPQRLRTFENNALADAVVPIKLNDDGTLQVSVRSTNQIKTLVTDYLW